MNTIIINDTDIPNQVILPYQILTHFIFDDFKVIIQNHGVKVGVSIDHEYELLEIRPHSAGDRNRKARYQLVENPFGYKPDFVDATGQKLYLGASFLPGEDISDERWLAFVNNAGWFAANKIIRLMAHIMNESEKRKRIHKEKQSRPQRSDRREVSRSTNAVYLLADIINYVSDNYIPSEQHHDIQCPCWEVRGHYRHYKNGNTVFIRSYQKGKERYKEKPKEKEYYI